MRKNARWITYYQYAIALFLSCFIAFLLRENIGCCPEKVGASEPDIIKVGSCGEDASFILTNDGIMTITGSGVIRRDSWYAYDRNKVKKVIIESGITAIENMPGQVCLGGLGGIFTPFDDAFFRDFENLETVSLPETLISIAAHSFQGCTNLREIHLPDSLQTIL